MTKAAFEKIKTGLGEAKAYLDGPVNKRSYGIHVPARVNVKKIRTRLGLSQESFAQTGGRDAGSGEIRLTIQRVCP